MEVEVGDGDGDGQSSIGVGELNWEQCINIGSPYYSPLLAY